MNRATKLFLVFLIAFLGCVALFVYYGMGVELTRQTLVGDDRMGPIVVLRLDKLKDTTETGDFLKNSHQPRVSLLIAVDGKMILNGRVSYVPIGEVASEWDFLSIARLRRSVDYSNVSTSPEYRLIKDSTASYLEDSISYNVETSIRSTLKGRVVALFANVVEDQKTTWFNLIEDSLNKFDGTVVLSAPLTQLSVEGDFPVNVLAVIQFPNFDDAILWLNDTQRAADFAVAADFARQVNVMVVDTI